MENNKLELPNRIKENGRKMLVTTFAPYTSIFYVETATAKRLSKKTLLKL